MPSFTDKLQVNGQEMEMYASLPSGSGPFPAVVIAFHVGGLDEFDKAMADRLAAEGYVAVVPDLFHRLSPEVMAGPRLDRLGHLSDPDIIADCNAAVAFLQGYHRLLHGRPCGLVDGGYQSCVQGRCSLLRRQHHDPMGRGYPVSL